MTDDELRRAIKRLMTDDAAPLEPLPADAPDWAREQRTAEMLMARGLTLDTVGDETDAITAAALEQLTTTQEK